MRIENGSMIGAAIWVNDKIVELTLALVRLEWPREPVLRFISDDLSIVTESFYSGGSTGAGISDWRLKEVPEVKEVITKNFWEIKAYLEAEWEKKKKQEEEIYRKAHEKLMRIRQTPMTKPSAIPGILFQRSEPEIVHNRTVTMHLSIIATETDQRLFLSDYVARDGKKLVKKFERDMSLYWKHPPKMSPREILRVLAQEFEVLRKNWA